MNPSYTGKTTAFMSARELIQYRQDGRARRLSERLDAELREENEANRAAGLLSHRHPTDPWADSELRACLLGCSEHGGAA